MSEKSASDREDRSEAMRRIASSVALDLSNVLTVILGYADLIAGDASYSDQHRLDAEEITKAARRGSDLARKLLVISREQTAPPAEATEQPLIAPAPPIPAPRLASETVLIVENEDNVRRITQRFLESAGYRVLTASGGAEATEIFAQHGGDIDLLLTDVFMSGLSGPDLFQTLVARKPELNVLYMSGSIEDAVGVVRGLPLMQKPFTMVGLARAVRAALAAAETQSDKRSRQP